MTETELPAPAFAPHEVLWPTFHDTIWLWLLPLVLLGMWLLLHVARRGRQRALAAFAAQRLLGSLLESLSKTRRAFKTALFVLGVLCILLALARPQYGYIWKQSTSRGIDIMFVLDASRSMLATDIKPDRLQRAKLAVLDFVEKLQGDRIGLVAFAGDAFVQCPLTLDYHVFDQALESIDTDVIPVGGTDFAKAIDVAQAAFAKDNNHKILILITDGEDLEGEGLRRAREASADGVTIYTVGVGTAEGSLIPLRDRYGRQDFVRDESGQPVTTRLEAETLVQIAEATGGFYEPLGSNGMGLDLVYQNGLQHFARQELSAQMKREGIDRFQWPLLAALVLLAWEPLVSNRRNGGRRRFRRLGKTIAKMKKETTATETLVRALVVSLTLGVGLAIVAPSARAAQPEAQSNQQTETQSDSQTSTLSTADAEAEPVAVVEIPQPAVSQRKAERLFRNGDFAAAEQAFARLLQSNPENQQNRYNLANSLYEQGKYSEASQAYSQVIASSDLALQTDAFYNLGLTHYAQGAQAVAEAAPAQAQSQSEQAFSASAQALQTGNAVLQEAARLQTQNAAHQQSQQTAGSVPAQPQAQPEQPEVPQQAVQQAIQLAEQAQQASESATQSGEAFIQKAQSATQFWQRARANFGSAGELAPASAGDALHNAEQTQKGIDALRAGVSQRQRANQQHGKQSEELERMIEELKKLLKEPPQQDQNDQQNQQDQNQQDNQQQQQDQQNQDNQQDQQDQNQQNQQDQQGQQGQQNDQQQQQQNKDDANSSESSGEQDKNDSQQQKESGEDDSSKDDGKQENADGQKDEQQDEQQGEQDKKPQDGKDGQQNRDGEKDRDGEQQPAAESEQQSGQQQQQDQGSQPRREGAGREETGEQAPAELTQEQLEQMAATQTGSEQVPAAGEERRAGAMSQQEAAGLLESLRGSGKLLPLSGRGLQSGQQTRPSRDW